MLRRERWKGDVGRAVDNVYSDPAPPQDQAADNRSDPGHRTSIVRSSYTGQADLQKLDRVSSNQRLLLFSTGRSPTVRVDPDYIRTSG